MDIRLLTSILILVILSYTAATALTLFDVEEFDKKYLSLNEKDKNIYRDIYFIGFSFALVLLILALFLLYFNKSKNYILVTTIVSFLLVLFYSVSSMFLIFHDNYSDQTPWQGIINMVFAVIILIFFIFYVKILEDNIKNPLLLD